MLTNPALRDDLAANIKAIRRTLWREMFLGVVSRAGGLDLSFAQFAALLFVEGAADSTVSALAAALSRSLPSTSRLVEDLVGRGLIVRQEDPADRRVRRLRVSEKGRSLIASMEQGRVETQLAAMDLMSPEQQEIISRGTSLLAQAVARRYQHDSGNGFAAKRDDDPAI